MQRSPKRKAGGCQVGFLRRRYLQVHHMFTLHATSRFSTARCQTDAVGKVWTGAPGGVPYHVRISPCVKNPTSIPKARGIPMKAACR